MPIVWLASYPKSGSTWFRLLLAGLSAGDDDAPDVNRLYTAGIASDRAAFEENTLLDSSLLTHDEIDRLRPRVYEALAADAAVRGTVQFVKVHDAYSVAPGGEPLLGGARAASGAIVIVRDPRGVAASLAHHQSWPMDDAIAFMNRSDADTVDLPQLRQRLYDWSTHAGSWLDQRDLPTCLVRYEDLHDDTVGVLLEALAFAGCPSTRNAAERAVRLTSFDALQASERAGGFAEARSRSGRPFFRRGQKDGWRDELSPAQIASVEAAHGPMMRRLGYALRGAHGDSASGPLG